jgi:hypothetical protein
MTQMLEQIPTTAVLQVRRAQAVRAVLLELAERLELAEQTVEQLARVALLVKAVMLAAKQAQRVQLNQQALPVRKTRLHCQRQQPWAIMPQALEFPALPFRRMQRLQARLVVRPRV